MGLRGKEGAAGGGRRAAGGGRRAAGCAKGKRKGAQQGVRLTAKCPPTGSAGRLPRFHARHAPLFTAQQPNAKRQMPKKKQGCLQRVSHIYLILSHHVLPLQPCLTRLCHLSPFLARPALPALHHASTLVLSRTDPSPLSFSFSFFFFVSCCFLLFSACNNPQPKGSAPRKVQFRDEPSQPRSFE